MLLFPNQTPPTGCNNLSLYCFSLLLLPTNNKCSINAGHRRDMPKECYIEVLHFYSCSTSDKWAYEHRYSLTFHPIFSKQTGQSQSPKSSSSNDYFLCVWRRTSGQHRWSKKLIPTRHNPRRLKYHQSRAADMSEGLQAERWPTERSGHTTNRTRRDEDDQLCSHTWLIYVCGRQWHFYHKSS